MANKIKRMKRFFEDRQPGAALTSVLAVAHFGAEGNAGAGGDSSNTLNSAGDPPKATIDKPDNVIEMDDGTWAVGVGVSVTFKATITDKDKHKSSPSATPEDVDDTFNKKGAIQWSERNNKGDILGGTTTSATFTALEAGDYELVLKVKDDGTYFQDLQNLTEVQSVKISVVNPDGVRVKSNGVVLTSGAVLTGAESKGPVTWQVTYGGKDLVWKGHLCEKFKRSSTCQSFQATYSYNSNGAEQFPNWNTAGDYATKVTDGTLVDNQGTGSGHPFNNNTIWDGSGLQEVGYVDGKSGNKVSLGQFKNQLYIQNAGGQFSVFTQIAP